MIRKRRYFYIIGVIILVISITIIQYKIKPPYTFEIPDTRIHYERGYIGDEDLVAYRYCMSINPPQDESNMIDLMLDYCRKNRESLESIGEYQTNMKVNIYKICFYKETFKFRRTWKPKKKDDVGQELVEYVDYRFGSVEYYSKGDNNIYIEIKRNNDISDNTIYILNKSAVFD